MKPQNVIMSEVLESGKVVVCATNQESVRFLTRECRKFGEIRQTRNRKFLILVADDQDDQECVQYINGYNARRLTFEVNYYTDEWVDLYMATSPSA